MWSEPLLGPNFVPNFRKIVIVVSEINASLKKWTNRQTNGTDSISPFDLQPGNNYYMYHSIQILRQI